MRAGRWLQWLSVPIALLGIGLTPGTSQATIMFTTGNVTPFDVITHFDATSSTTALGRLGGAMGPQVIQLSTDQPLVVTANGQANVAVQTNSGTGFQTFTFTPNAPTSGFTLIDFNPEIAPGSGTNTTFTLSATDNFGMTFTSGTFPLNQGNNRVAAFAVTGTNEVITSLTLTAAQAAVFDIRQVRVEIGTAVTPVPEPVTIVMALSGLVPLGLIGMRRLRNRPNE